MLSRSRLVIALSRRVCACMVVVLACCACARGPRATPLVPVDHPEPFVLFGELPVETLGTLGARTMIERTARFHDVMMRKEPARPLAAPADAATAANDLRAQLRDRIFGSGVAATWAAHRPTEVRTTLVATWDDYEVHTVHVDVLPGLWVPGVLYVPADVPVGGAPAMLMLNGHSDENHQDDIQRRAINLAKRGIVVLQLEWFGQGQLSSGSNSHHVLNRLELCGTHALAPMVLTLLHALDVLAADERVDASRLGVAGLSGGGWQTLWLAALDERVRFANPVAGFAAWDERAALIQAMGDSEQTPSDLYTTADYTDLVRLVAPRSLLLTYNTEDQYFPADPCLGELEGARGHFERLGAPHALHSFVSDTPGTHVMQEQAREALYRFVDDAIGLPRGGVDDIDVDEQLLTQAVLSAPLPVNNRTLRSLANEACADLPRAEAIPDAAGLPAWQATRRAELVSLLRMERTQEPADPKLVARGSGSLASGASVTLLDLNVEGFQAPLVLVVPHNAPHLVVLLDDSGRASNNARVQALLDDGVAVAVFDPLHLGDAVTRYREWLYVLMVQGIGERSLGIQAHQLLAAAELLSARTGLSATVEARGPRTTTLALAAAALEPAAFERVTVREALVTFASIGVGAHIFPEMPTLFVKDLLAGFDAPALVALASPTPIVVADDDGRFVDAWAPALAVGRE